MQPNASDEHDGNKISEGNNVSQLEEADAHDKVGILECNTSSQLKTADEHNDGIAECNTSIQLGEVDGHSKDCGVENQNSIQLEKTYEHTEDCGADSQNSSQIGATDERSEDCSMDIHKSDQFRAPVEHSEDRSIENQPSQLGTPETKLDIANEAGGFNKDDDDDFDSYPTSGRRSYQLAATECKPLSSLLEADEWNNEDQGDDDVNSGYYTMHLMINTIHICPSTSCTDRRSNLVMELGTVGLMA